MTQALCERREPKTVLVVDDDQDIREVVADALAAEGYRVITASDGREAIALLRRVSVAPSLILLDLMMPGMDGAQFREEQRRDPALEGIPVVVVSADMGLGSAAHSLGVAAHLRKPVLLDALLAAVREHCR